MRVADFSRRCGGRFGTLHVPTVVRVSPQPCPREPEIPFGRSPSPSLVSAVTSVSVIPFRHNSLAKRNGARRRTEEGEKTGGGENSAVAGDVPAAARLFPFFSRARCTIPQDAPASSGTSCSRGHVDTLCNTSEGNPMAFIFFLIVAIKAFVIFAEKNYEIWICIYHDQQVPQRVIHW